MKKLGFGMMRLPLTDRNDLGSIDLEYTKKLVDEFINRGFTYFDTAWMYCGGKSEAAMKEVLTSRWPRDSYTLTSKLPAYMLHSLEDRDKIFNEQLRRTGVDYFDTYLLHEISSETIDTFRKYDCFSWIKQKKEEGKIKRFGFSYHDGADMLDRILTEFPEFEVVQLQINYLDWENPGIQSRACHEVAVKHGKPIIIMEPVKGGTLAQVPEEVEKLFKEYDNTLSVPSWAIRFAAGLQNVEMVLSGMSNMEQLLDNLGYMSDFVPLTDEETAMVFRAVDIINSNVAIPCTGCNYCTVDCPKNIAIPQYFSLYNADLQEIAEKKWTTQQAYYSMVSLNFGKPVDCIKCGQCEGRCPQKLPVMSHLDEVGKYFAQKG